MTSTIFQEQFFRFLITVSALLFLFIFGGVMGYNPIIGFVLTAGLGFILAYYYSPPWFAYLYIFTVSMAALLNLPVTEGGFSSAVAIALASFCLGILGALVSRDPALIRIFFGRADQILPILFLCLMFISLKNSHGIGQSAKQIQQFVYLVVIYYFLHLVIRNRETFRKAFFVLLLGGTLVGILGVVEVVKQSPVYFILGGKSLFGAEISDAFLNAKAGRINGLIGDAPFHGIYMCVIALVSLYFLFTSMRLWVKVSCVLVFFLSVFNILGTGSRGALIALLLALFLFWVFAEIPHKAVIMSSTKFRMISKLRFPTACVRMPSAMVFGGLIRTISFFRNDCWQSFAGSVSTPITLMPGNKCFAATALPAMRPPPPTGTKR